MTETFALYVLLIGFSIWFGYSLKRKPNTWLVARKVTKKQKLGIPYWKISKIVSLTLKEI